MEQWTPHQVVSAMVGIGRATSVRDALRATAKAMTDLVGGDAIYAWWDDGTERVVVTNGLTPIDALSQTWSLLSESEPLRTRLDASEDPVLAALGWPSATVLRVALEGPGMGTLVLFRRHDGAFTEDDQELAQELVTQTRFALEAVSFGTERMRLKDELTT